MKYEWRREGSDGWRIFNDRGMLVAIANRWRSPADGHTPDVRIQLYGINPPDLIGCFASISDARRFLLQRGV